MWLLILVWQLFPYCLAVSEGAVRLVPYHSKIDLVEIYYQQQWLPVYDDNWTLQDATVICNQLGYQTIVTQTLTCSPPTTSVVISELICNGEDAAISQCNIKVSNDTSSSLRAGVICANSFDVQLFTNNTFSSFDGILTMYTNTGWYPVCGETVDKVEVTVICRELGYENGTMVFQWTDEIANNSFVLLGDNCTGDEFKLKSCIKQNIDIVQDCFCTVYVQCYGPPSPPCIVSTSSPTSCDTVTLEWLPFNNSNINYFYIWYRQYPLTLWNSLESNVTSLIIEGLLPATLYEFKVTSSNSYGNSTFSNSLFLTTQQERIPPTNIISVDQITAESITITWELYFLNCSTLIAFEIILNDSLRHYLYRFSLTDKELVKQDTKTGLTNYTTSVTKLSTNTLYTVVVRTIVGHASSDDLYRVSSEPWNFTTLTTGPTVKQFFLYNTFLVNPYISLVFLLIILALILLLLVIICTYVIIKRCCSGKRKRKRRLPYRITSSDDTSQHNIYLTGDLSDQSYIPMVTSSVQTTTTRRTSNSATNYWIDIPEMTTTFTSVTDEQHSSTPLQERENNDDNDDESLDNPYDEIPADNNLIDDNDEEEDGNLYDEIPQLSDLEQSNSHENLLKIPPCQLSLSQEQSDVPLGPMIPPPMEFAGLPERRTATINVPIYSKAKPKHLRHHSLDKSSPDKTSKMSLKSKSQVALNFVDKEKHDTSPTKTTSTPKINTTEEDVPYYSVPPYSNKQITNASSKESFDEECPSSPEYETLVHPKLVDTPASPTTSEDVKTLPCVPPRPLSKKSPSNVAKEN